MLVLYEYLKFHQILYVQEENWIMAVVVIIIIIIIIIIPLSIIDVFDLSKFRFM
jgi:hypothetical protein